MKLKTAQDPQAREWICLPFIQALNAGDVGGAAACFARDACFVTQDATAIHGRENIRLVLAQLIARNTRIEREFGNVLVSGDVALAQERWAIRAGGVKGSSLEQIWVPSLVLRRIEGRWRLAIAAPWGWGRQLAA